ncbi:hypothetical protein LTR28_011271 [Elasticomyces elasticus]|nr:hypothetical protein LTR28_011271 [Elasticomyces elasticus]
MGGRATITTDGATKYEIRGRGRRSTRIKDDVEAVQATQLTKDRPSPTKPTFSPTKTAPPPARFESTTQSSQAWAPRPPSPISPAAVADAIEAKESQLAAGISTTWHASRAHELLHRARAVLSTPAGVHLTFIALESIGLQRSIWPAHYAFSTPALPPLRLPSLPVSLPNPFYLLTSHFWAPALLWAATSFLLPLLVAWFFNLSVRARQPRSGGGGGRRSDALPLPPILQQQQLQQQQQQPKHPIDPATFAVAKTLLTYLVFSDEYAFRFWGAVADATVARVAQGVWGGWHQMMIGGYVGIFCAAYVACQKR